jgi:hypothetical protein
MAAHCSDSLSDSLSQGVGNASGPGPSTSCTVNTTAKSMQNTETIPALPSWKESQTNRSRIQQRRKPGMSQPLLRLSMSSRARTTGVGVVASALDLDHLDHARLDGEWDGYDNWNGDDNDADVLVNPAIYWPNRNYRKRLHYVLWFVICAASLAVAAIQTTRYIQAQHRPITVQHSTVEPALQFPNIRVCQFGRKIHWNDSSAVMVKYNIPICTYYADVNGQGFLNGVACPPKIDHEYTYTSSAGPRSLFCSEWDFQNYPQYKSHISSDGTTNSRSYVAIFGCSEHYPSGSQLTLTYGPTVGIVNNVSGTINPNFISADVPMRTDSTTIMDLVLSRIERQGEPTVLSYELTGKGSHAFNPLAVNSSDLCFYPAISFASHSVTTYVITPSTTFVELLGTVGGSISAMFGLRSLIIAATDAFMKSKHFKR